MSFKIGDYVTILPEFIEEESNSNWFIKFIEDCGEKTVYQITDDDPAYDSMRWFALDDWEGSYVDEGLDYDDPYLFQRDSVKHVLPIKDTRLARKLYKDRIFKEEDGLLWIK